MRGKSPLFPKLSSRLPKTLVLSGTAGAGGRAGFPNPSSFADRTHRRWCRSSAVEKGGSVSYRSCLGRVGPAGGEANPLPRRGFPPAGSGGGRGRDPAATLPPPALLPFLSHERSGSGERAPVGGGSGLLGCWRRAGLERTKPGWALPVSPIHTSSGVYFYLLNTFILLTPPYKDLQNSDLDRGSCEGFGKKCEGFGSGVRGI